MTRTLLLLPFLVACAGDHPQSDAAHGRKLMGLQEKFDRFDYNADGELTVAELKLGIEESDTTGVTPVELKVLMEEYDVNRDGAISRWETQRAINSPLPDVPQ